MARKNRRGGARLPIKGRGTVVQPRSKQTKGSVRGGVASRVIGSVGGKKKKKRA